MQKKQTILVVASLLVVVLSVTLAYFTAQIIGKGKNVTINSADLKIIFTDSDGAISGSNIEPGWSDTKTFTIENKSNETYKYNIVIQDLVNTFVTNGYLQYKITSTNNGYNMTEFKDVPKSETATDTILAYSASIDVGVTQTYTVEFIYKNDESVDQSEDMGKTLSGKLFITEGTINIYAGYEKGTLGYQIMGDNPTRGTRSNNNNGTNDFATPLTATTTGTLFTSTESITGITDSPKEVYYYAGNTTNNLVKFGTFASDLVRGYYSATSTSFKEYTTLEECNSASSYNTNCSYAWRKGDPMYWRIIRTNHDGSIRLLYAGTSPDTTEDYIGESAFNARSNSPKYAGYKYGEDTSLDTIRNNTTDSKIKTYIDTWYKNNLTNYTKYLSTSTVYCNDRSEGTGQIYNYTSSPSSQFNFASYYRMDNDTKGAKANPSYNCTDKRDAFSVDNTSAKLDYPIALMTADEIAFAGGVAKTKMNTPYAWFTINSAGSQVSTYWWSLSPVWWGDENSSSVWYWRFDSAYLNEGIVFVPCTVRPVLSLKSCTLYSTGNGTAETPYEIVETSSGC